MENFCSQPWVGIDISTQGEFKPCCKFLNTISDNLEDYKNSKLLKELQDFHANNERHPGCKRCWDDEDSGILSKRQLDNHYVLKDKNVDISKNKINLLGLTFGNTCNLACRTCSSFASSRWLQEIKSHGNFNNQKIYKHSKFYKEKKFFDNLFEMLDDELHIDFAGGEPLLTGTHEHLDFIKFLLPKGNKISLHYTTNCTNYPSLELLELWKNFKKVDIQFSIDGIGNKLEYLRWPANWDTVYNNIKEYQKFQKQNSNIQISISHTLSVLNVESLPEFLDWCNLENLPEPYIGIVSNPVEYNIKTLPLHKKRIITDIIGTRCPQIVSFMNSEDLSHNFFKTKKYTEFLDKQRNQTFQHVFPQSIIFI